jgi:diacylglycerol O-acyltransferase / wax synthase
VALTRLSDEDTRILALESPTIAGHVCKLLIVERPLTVEALQRHVADRLPRARRLGQRLAPTPLGIANPVWVDDDAFEIGRHVRRVEADEPVGRERLLGIAAALMAERLDRSRPLWRIDVVEHLTGERSALIWRVHHSMADGLTAFRLGSIAIWDAETDEGLEEHDRWVPEPAPGAVRLAALGARARLGAVAGDAREAVAVVRSPRRLASLARAAGRMPAVIARELRPGGARTALERSPGAKRALATATAPLDELKRIERSFGDAITVNDVVLAVVGGGLRRWLPLRGEGLTGVRAKVPVSLHHQEVEPDSLGNHDSFMFVDLAVSDSDPVERLLEINRETRTRKFHRDPQVLYDFFRDVHAVVRPFERMASRWAMSPRLFALNVSNCPGPPTSISVCGHEVSEFYSFAEIASRHALRIAVVSVADTVSFGLCADRALAPDLDVLAAGIEAELQALSAAADATARPRPYDPPR